MMIRTIGPFGNDGFFILVFSNSEVVSVRKLILFWAYYRQLNYRVFATEYQSIYLVLVEQKFEKGKEICLEVKNRNDNWDEMTRYSFKKDLEEAFDWNSLSNSSAEKKISKRYLDDLYPYCMDEFMKWDAKNSR